MQVGNEHLKFQLRFVTSILKVRLEIADQYSLKVPRSWKTNTDWETIKVEETKGTYQLRDIPTNTMCDLGLDLGAEKWHYWKNGCNWNKSVVNSMASHVNFLVLTIECTMVM